MKIIFPALKNMKNKIEIIKQRRDKLIAQREDYLKLARRFEKSEDEGERIDADFYYEQAHRCFVRISELDIVIDVLGF